MSGLCEKCADKACPDYYHEIVECQDFQPMRNADKIRAMTDEELARYLDNMQGLAYINGFDSEPIRLYPNNYGAWLDWLRQEVEE